MSVCEVLKRMYPRRERFNVTAWSVISLLEKLTQNVPNWNMRVNNVLSSWRRVRDGRIVGGSSLVISMYYLMSEQRERHPFT